MATNLLTTDRNERSRYYGSFRGVDFSSDHTNVADNRFAFLSNMYRDYQSGQGQAIETIPGFRRLFSELGDETIYGVHTINVSDDSGVIEKRVLVHAGMFLYLWDNYPHTVNVTLTTTKLLPTPSGAAGPYQAVYQIEIPDAQTVTAVKDRYGDALDSGDYSFNNDTKILTIHSATMEEGDIVAVSYIENTITQNDALFGLMNGQKSTSFVFNNRLYILDGKNYLVYDPVAGTVSEVVGYIPTTDINIRVGVDGDTGTPYENRNLLSPFFRSTYIADGVTKTYNLNVPGVENIHSLKIYGTEKVFSAEIRNYGSFIQHVSENHWENLYIETYNGHLVIRHRDGSTVYSNEILLSEFGLYISRTLHEGDSIQLDRRGVMPKASGYIGFSIDPDTSIVSFFNAPASPESELLPEAFAGVEIIARKEARTISGISVEGIEVDNIIKTCTLATLFDNRVFLSGNPKYPNNIFWSTFNAETGFADPTYFPDVYHQQDGVGISPITGMMQVADSLLVLKSDTDQDGALYYHTKQQTGDDLYTALYPSTQGLAGIGCLGACRNFLDDPVFISRLGMEAVGQLSVRLERSVEHRSSLIDARLLNLDLSNAVMEEWNGYLVLLVSGKIFLADSRQAYADSTGIRQYEWYLLEDIGVYDGQYPEYRYSVELPEELEGQSVMYCPTCRHLAHECTCADDTDQTNVPFVIADQVFDFDLDETKDLRGQVANPPNDEGSPSVTVHHGTAGGYPYHVVIHEVKNRLNGQTESYEALLCYGQGNQTGGIFRPANIVKTIDERLLFGTENGCICCFNTDKRNEQLEIPHEWYDFDGRTIVCGIATKMDNCGIPHLTKNTVKKSTVIKTKDFLVGAAKIRVRTNRNPFNQIARKSLDQIIRIHSSNFSFEQLDFADLTFGKSLFAVNEKEKKWVEKQYYVYSDEYHKPFAIYYIAYRYYIHGRYKEGN